MIYSNLNNKVNFKSVLNWDYEKHIPEKYKIFIKPITIKDFKSIDKDFKKKISYEYAILEHLKEKLHLNILNYNYSDYDRFENIKTFDHSMVKLENHFKYMNANFIKNIFDSNDNHNYFIASQFPVENSFLDFWRIIFKKKVSLIIMINELGYEKNNIVNYWLPKNQNLKLNEFTITLINEEDIIINKLKILIKRTFKIINNIDNTELITNQYHIFSWVDFGKPATDNTILAINYLLNKSNEKVLNKEEIFIHCRAGIGRTGTFMSLFFLKKFIDENKNDMNKSSLSIFYLVLSLREYRFNLVQTEEQYLFLYQFVLNYLKNK